MARVVLVVALLTFAAFLAGCSDDGDDGGDGTPTTTTRPTGTASGSPTTGPGPVPGPVAPIYINGTVTGVADCTLAPQVGAQTGTTESVPAAAWNGSYELSFLSDIPVTAICIAWGEDAFSTSMIGVVPPSVTEVTVAADGAPQGASFSIKITPAAASGMGGGVAARAAAGPA